MLLLKNNKSINRGSILILGFTFFVTLRIMAYDSNPDSLTSINTGISAMNPDVTQNRSGNSLSFTTTSLFNKQTRKLEIIIYDPHLKIKTELKGTIPKNIVIQSSPIFAINKNYLIIQDDDAMNLHLFSISNTNFIFKNTIKLPEKTKFFCIQFLEKNLFLFSDMYNHHPLEKKFNVSLSIYDASKNKIINTIHPELPCIALSHLDHRWIEFNLENIFLVEPCGNAIHVYDHNLKEEKIIHIETDSKWIDLPKLQLPFETSTDKIHPKFLIEKLKPFIHSFNHIEFISIVNDTLLFLSCTNSDSTSKNESIAFIYNLKEYKLKNHIEFTRNSKQWGNNSISEELTTIFNSKLLIGNKSISISSDSYKPDKNLKYNENQLLKDKYYETHNPEFIIELAPLHLVLPFYE